ncbi:rhamnosyltransferase [Sphingopyxis panaciterrae]|uniref:glycosyltransferase n=1 Tax=Sphingopyxis panaciterrae TaxID=363841 RepID=UPI00142466B7|nr:glycosyltransferase [Sphingopyxis panaciterrae]NIJ36409.1 rhamnosyltransferase [Sphingopyxis panaciterrae]
MHDIPRVAVLLASYNGAGWIGEQIASIVASRGVATHIFLSDDGSNDGTVAIAEKAAGDRLTLLPFSPSGSAGLNFFRLVKEAEWDGFDYVALADQDDIWEPEKLARAVAAIGQRNLSAYSSDITAFWPDGRRQYIRKSQPQQRWDHLFESAGPGNTFVFPVREAAYLREKLSSADPRKLRIADRHDWLFYAYFREGGKRWLIDDVSGLDYRQHESNVVGAAKGIRARLARFSLVNDGWYRSHILMVGDLTDASNPIIDYVRRPRLRHWWKLLVNARSFRRDFKESLAVMVILAMMALPGKNA